MYCREPGRHGGGRQYPATAERRRAAANLRPALAGQSCRAARRHDWTDQVDRQPWLQELREDCPTRVAGSAAIIAHAVARYDTLYREALDAWDLSQADKQTESVVEIETARGPKKKNHPHGKPGGRPGFLAEARRALDGIARIVARIAPRPGKVEASGSNCPTWSRFQASRRSVMSTLLSHHGRARSRHRAKTVPSGSSPHAFHRHHGGA